MRDGTLASGSISSALAFDVGELSGDPECRYCHERYVRKEPSGPFN
jgi:hypothetical protein